MTTKSTVMTSSLTGESFESVDVELSDSDSWQVIDPSDSDDVSFSYGDVSTTDEDDVVPDIDDLLQHPYGSPASDVSMQSVVDIITHQFQTAQEIDRILQIVDGDNTVSDEGGDDSEEDEVEADNEDSDFDDELVPKWLNNKFERQRIRKLGKRAYPKMQKSKRVANMYNKPGCVHGKHGLGMKHNLLI